MEFFRRIAALAERYGGDADEPLAVMECGRRELPVAAGEPGEVYCHRGTHYRDGAVTGRCPVDRAREIRGKLGAERRRLVAEISRIEEGSPFGWDGFNARREGLQGGVRALAVMRRFAAELPGNVVLAGPRGLGKTHLLLASHFALLERGVSSVYVRTPELRRLFRALDSYTEAVVEEAQVKLHPILYAQAVHFDDAGHIEDDARARGQFAEGLKDLLDRSRGRWATATNRSAAEAEHHPDLSGVILSRLMFDADLVKLEGFDYRATTLRTA